MKAVLIRFDPELLARLQQTAERNNLSLAALVRFIVEDWFKRKDYESTTPPQA